MPPTHATSILRGLLLVILAGMCFALLDANAKWLGQSYPVTQVVWMRYAIGAIIAVLYAARALRWTMFATRHPWLQASRGALLLICTASNFIALNYLPMALVLAVIFTAPLMTCALSVPLLGEKVGWRRWTAVLVGFAGVLIAMKPTSASISFGALIAILGAFGSAVLMLVTRELRGTSQTFLAFTQVCGTLLFGAVYAPFVWVTPQWSHVGIFLVAGVVSVCGLLCANRALTLAPASVLAPYKYTAIGFAALFGYLVFGDLPSLNTIIGAVIIVASGLYIFMRERKLAKAEPVVTPQPA
jgi:drug/metabolite transporter (DMT)-like permease